MSNESLIISFGIIVDFLTNILDIFLVAIIIYFLMKIIVSSEKFIMIVNLVLIFLGTYVLSIVLNLETLRYLFDNIMSWIVVIIIVLFQPEIRNSIEKYAKFKKIDLSKSVEEEFIEDLKKGVYNLAKIGSGALITIQRNTMLESYTKSATEIDAKFSSALLETIFNKESPLHDGACIILEKKIIYSGVFFPISLDLNISKEYGTRHRAGLTISQESDSITIIVSEEKNNVSLAYNGKLYYDVSEEFFGEFIKNKIGE